MYNLDTIKFLVSEIICFFSFLHKSYVKTFLVVAANFDFQLTHNILKPETFDQPDRETCILKCHYSEVGWELLINSS